MAITRKGRKAVDIQAESNARAKEAYALRKDGWSYPKISKHMGCSVTTARHYVYMVERGYEWVPPWWNGLSSIIVAYLRYHGFNSREDCLILGSDGLKMKGGKVVDPRYNNPADSPYRGHGTLSFSRVNEVRVWLGAEPLKYKYAATEDQIKRAIRLLTDCGYTVTENPQ